MKKYIAIVVSRFNHEVTDKLLAGAKSKLLSLNVEEKNILIYKVPGAIEIPLIAKKIAQSQQTDAIICLGAVICGETGHYDYVCQQVSEGCQKIMLDFDIPIIFGVLTTKNLQQALDRSGGKKGHKGEEAAKAAIEMINLMHEVSSFSVNGFSNQADKHQA